MLRRMYRLGIFHDSLLWTRYLAAYTLFGSGLIFTQQTPDTGADKVMADYLGVQGYYAFAYSTFIFGIICALWPIRRMWELIAITLPIPFYMLYYAFGYIEGRYGLAGGFFLSVLYLHILVSYVRWRDIAMVERGAIDGG